MGLGRFSPGCCHFSQNSSLSPEEEVARALAAGKVEAQVTPKPSSAGDEARRRVRVCAFWGAAETRALIVFVCPVARGRGTDPIGSGALTE